MENYISISLINDFIFCPRSIYFHNLYYDKSLYLYEGAEQFAGTAAHSTIDNQTYSTKKDILQGLTIYSEKYNLCGKLDTFFVDKCLLRERKKRIVQIYDGYIFQLYAQYYCLIEMEYIVKKLELYSLDTNKIFDITLPEKNPSMHKKFEEVIEDMNSFSLEKGFIPNKNKCLRCIYSPICDKGE